MTARIEKEDSQGESPAEGTVPAAGDLRAGLLGRPPGPIEVGSGTAILLDGELDAGGREISAVRVRIGRLEAEVDAFGMPPPRSYGPGPRWWALVAIPGDVPLGEAGLSLLVESAGEWHEVPLGSLELVGSLEPPQLAEPVAPEGGPAIAICMATYEPPAEQLKRQLDSIRAQTNTDWICLISDDCSSADAVAKLESQIAGDPRFVLSRSSERLGFYRNFERALRMVPAGAELVGFADQDDRWDPDKLDALVELLDANPGAALGYSDMRIATDEGEILSETSWYLRRNSYDDIASLLIANTVTGAASLFRRELLDIALPLPPAHPAQQPYHDHWLAQCSLALGSIAYLDRPTYDYTRHGDSVTIRAQPGWLAPPSGRWGGAQLRWRRLTRRMRLGRASPGGRSIYFRRYLLMRQFIRVLELRLGGHMTPSQRRELHRLDAADRSIPAAAWLLARSLRPLIGHNETLGSERVLFLGLLWRRIVGRRARRT